MKVNWKDLFARFHGKRVLKYALYMFLALLCQNMLFTRLRILGVCPMVLPAVAIAVGMFEGSSWGAVFGLIMGLFADMAYMENTILFTVTFPALAFAAGFVSHFFINQRFFAYMGAAALGLLAMALLQMMGTFARDVWSPALLLTALLQTLWSVPLAALAYPPLIRWVRN